MNLFILLNLFSPPPPLTFFTCCSLSVLSEGREGKWAHEKRFGGNWRRCRDFRTFVDQKGLLSPCLKNMSDFWKRAGDIVVAQALKHYLLTPIGVPVWVLAASLPGNEFREATEESPSFWTPVIDACNSDGILGSWLWPGLALAVVTICTVNQRIDDLFLSVYLPFTLKKKLNKVICIMSICFHPKISVTQKFYACVCISEKTIATLQPRSMRKRSLTVHCRVIRKHFFWALVALCFSVISTFWLLDSIDKYSHWAVSLLCLTLDQLRKRTDESGSCWNAGHLCDVLPRNVSLWLGQGPENHFLDEGARAPSLGGIHVSIF